MAKRTTYYVLPEGDDWKVRKQGAERAANIFENKQDAIERARELAQESRPSQLKVHNRKGRIQFEWTYGEDPEKYPS